MKTEHQVAEGERLTFVLPDGRRVVLQLVRVQRDMARFGCIADRDIPIHRHQVQAAVEWREGRCSSR